ncbi:MAG: hypothetical protein ACRC5T_01625 [Cetobacterium sp.]
MFNIKKLFELILVTIFITGCSTTIKNSDTTHKEILYASFEKNYHDGITKEIILDNEVFKERKFYGIGSKTEEFLINTDFGIQKFGINIGDVIYKKEKYSVINLYKKYLTESQNLGTRDKNIHPYALLYDKTNNLFLPLAVEGIENDKIYFSEKNNSALNRAILNLNFKKIIFQKILLTNQTEKNLHYIRVFYKGSTEHKHEFSLEESHDKDFKKILSQNKFIFSHNEKIIEIQNARFEINNFTDKKIEITFLKSKTHFEVLSKEKFESLLMPSAPNLTTKQGIIMGLSSFTPLGRSVNLIRTIIIESKKQIQKHAAK